MPNVSVVVARMVLSVTLGGKLAIWLQVLLGHELRHDAFKVTH